VVRFSEAGGSDENLTLRGTERKNGCFFGFWQSGHDSRSHCGQVARAFRRGLFPRAHRPDRGALIVVALLMWLGEKMSKLKTADSNFFADSLIVGVAQAFALIPGVSRSGSTITAGLFRNMTRDAAVRFSFLLSTPIIAGAALLKAHELRKEGLPAGMHAPFYRRHSLSLRWLAMPPSLG
jgi:hypothetical protein